MSLVANAVFANPNTPYWAKVQGSSGVVVEPGYVATADPALSAQNAQDTTGTGTRVIEIQNGTSDRWVIGVSGVEANPDVAPFSGSDFTLFSYGGGGSFIEAPLVISRTGATTIAGSVSAKADALGTSVVRAQSTDAPDSTTAYVQAYAGESRMGVTAGPSTVNFTETLIRNNFAAGASKLQVNVNGTPQNDVMTMTNATGQASFALPPQIAGTTSTVPFVLNGTFPDTFGGVSTTTLTPGNQAIFRRPFILVSMNVTTANNDAANAASIVPSCIVTDGGVFPSSVANAFGAPASLYDVYANTTYFLLVQGVHYSATSTQLNAVYTITGRMVGNVFSHLMLGLF